MLLGHWQEMPRDGTPWPLRSCTRYDPSALTARSADKRPGPSGASVTGAGRKIELSGRGRSARVHGDFDLGSRGRVDVPAVLLVPRRQMCVRRELVVEVDALHARFLEDGHRVSGRRCGADAYGVGKRLRDAVKARDITVPRLRHLDGACLVASSNDETRHEAAGSGGACGDRDRFDRAGWPHCQA